MSTIYICAVYNAPLIHPMCGEYNRQIHCVYIYIPHTSHSMWEYTRICNTNIDMMCGIYILLTYIYAPTPLYPQCDIYTHVVVYVPIYTVYMYPVVYGVLYIHTSHSVLGVWCTSLQYISTSHICGYICVVECTHNTVGRGHCDIYTICGVRVYIPLCVYIYVMCVWDIYIGDAPLRTHDTHTHYSHYSRGWYIDVYDIYICCIYIYVMCGHSHTVYIVCPVCWAY